MHEMNQIKISNVVPIRRPVLKRTTVEVKRLREIFDTAQKQNAFNSTEKYTNWLISCLYKRAYLGQNWICWTLNLRCLTLLRVQAIQLRIEKMGLNVEFFMRSYSSHKDKRRWVPTRKKLPGSIKISFPEKEKQNDETK